MSDARAPELVLRGDADARNGIGHAMRLLALGEAWVERGWTATWLVADAPVSLRDRAGAAGIEIVGIDDRPGSAADADAVVAFVGRSNRAVVVDGPAFDAAWLDRLAPIADRTAAVDDRAAFDRYPVRIVLNQNAHADRRSYPADRPTQYLLGLDYALLRREFRVADPSPRLPARADRLLVAFGGADPAAMTGRAIRSLRSSDASADAEPSVTVVVGPANPAAGEIQALAAEAAGRITVVESPERMVDLMAATDLAVVSGGSTVWELARMGVPAIVVETAPPEVDLCRGLRAIGLFDPLGPAATLDDATLAAAIARRRADAPWRERMSRLGQRLVDGHGTDRVIAALLAAIGSPIDPDAAIAAPARADG